jgi:hypothetical protein
MSERTERGGLYRDDEGRHGYTRHGAKAHRLYRVAPFPQAMTSCTSTPVVVTYRDDEMPDTEGMRRIHPRIPAGNPWCLHCYPLRSNTR